MIQTHDQTAYSDFLCQLRQGKNLTIAPPFYTSLELYYTNCLTHHSSESTSAKCVLHCFSPGNRVEVLWFIWSWRLHLHWEIQPSGMLHSPYSSCRYYWSSFRDVRERSHPIATGLLHYLIAKKPLVFPVQLKKACSMCHWLECNFHHLADSM